MRSAVLIVVSDDLETVGKGSRELLRSFESSLVDPTQYDSKSHHSRSDQEERFTKKSPEEKEPCLKQTTLLKQELNVTKGRKATAETAARLMPDRLDPSRMHSFDQSILSVE